MFKPLLNVVMTGPVSSMVKTGLCLVSFHSYYDYEKITFIYLLDFSCILLQISREKS